MPRLGTLAILRVMMRVSLQAMYAKSATNILIFMEVFATHDTLICNYLVLAQNRYFLNRNTDLP